MNEVEQYVTSLVDEIDDYGMRLVVRHGRARERKLTVGSGTAPIWAPRAISPTTGTAGAPPFDPCLIL